MMKAVLTIGAAIFLATGVANLADAASPSAKPVKSCKVMKSFDPDKDGTMDLAEAQKAAGALFDKLNADKDTTLELKELKGRVSKKEFLAANPDNDGSLDKKEFANLVEARFKAANPDNDGTIDCKELNSKAGRKLMKLLSR